MSGFTHRLNSNRSECTAINFGLIFCFGHAGEVFVTAIKYIRQTSSLIVGFNFACFQMWNMETLTHV